MLCFILSSPRAKRAGPKGLRAKSARAVTGRRNSHSGRGEDFLTGQPDFFQHEKGVLLESLYEGTKIFTPCPQKIGFGAQKRPNLAQTGILGQISAFLAHLI